MAGQEEDRVVVKGEKDGTNSTGTDSPGGTANEKDEVQESQHQEVDSPTSGNKGPGPRPECFGTTLQELGYVFVATMVCLQVLKQLTLIRLRPLSKPTEANWLTLRDIGRRDHIHRNW